MSRRILVIDNIATRRIVIKAKLRAAQYDVFTATDLREAETFAKTRRFDVVLTEYDLVRQAGYDIYHNTFNPKLSPHHHILVADPMSEARMVEAFQNGFDEVVQRPLSERILLAQLRALMRQDKEAATAPDSTVLDALPGIKKRTSTPARLAVVGSNLSHARHFATGMASADVGLKTKHEMITCDFQSVLQELRDGPELDAVLLLAHPGREEAALTLLSDLRSRGAASRAGIILGINGKQTSYAARAFDLGADQVISDVAGPGELAWRIDRVARNKQSKDLLRRKVRHGLRMALTDSLTGLNNRRFAMERLTQLVQAGDPYAVLMLDLDHFKAINDTYGHAIGDLVLTKVASALRDNLREHDLIARIGGEEFLVAIPNASSRQALHTAERLRAVINQMIVQDSEKDISVKVTASIGLFHSQDQTTTEVSALMAQVDTALYQAKSDGRNMVSMCSAA